MEEKKHLWYILGLPGVGKSRLAESLVNNHPNAVLLDTGEIKRSALDTTHRDHEKNKRFKDKLEEAEKGNYPTEGISIAMASIVGQLTLEALANVDIDNILIEGGVVRSEDRLQKVIDELHRLGLYYQFDHQALYLKAPTKFAVKKIATKRSSLQSQNLPINPDDKPSAVNRRVAFFHKETSRVISNFHSVQRLHIVDGTQSQEEIDRQAERIIFSKQK